MRGQKVRIVIGLERGDCRVWLERLAAGLAADGHAVRFAIRAGGGDAMVGLLASFERRFYGAARAWLPLHPDLLAKNQGEAPDLVLELSSGIAPPAGLALRVDGSGGASRLPHALIARHMPFVELVDAQGRVHAAGLPAAEEPDVLIRSLEVITERVVTLIRMASDGRARMAVPREQRPGVQVGSPLGFGFSSFVGRLRPKLGLAERAAEHWRVAIRRRDAEAGFEGDRLIEGFSFLPDDGQRYYADPILWEREGRAYLFVEEYPYATRRGIISVTELDGEGRPLGAPRPIIARRGHLSYPFLFAHDGETFMMPENAAEGHVPLYRATRFPDEWEELAPMITEPLHDATLVEHQGAWWLIGNATPDGGSSWDCLSLYRAASPLGPFAPHAANPVLVDARNTRSAGPVLRQGGRLVRPVQSCLGGYGRFIRFCTIDRLDADAFAQSQSGRLVAPLGGPITGVHTYACSARFEAIDALTCRNADPGSFNPRP